MIVIIDFGMGNLCSIQRSFKKFYNKVTISNDKNLISKANGLVVPGVGSFGDAVKELRDRNLFNFLKKIILEKPTLGICLGMQLLFESSEESPGIQGFALLKGNVKRLTETESIKIPHTGWNKLKPIKQPYFSGYTYFNHEYYCDPLNNEIILSWVLHGRRIPAIIAQNSILATQFHPEKSKEAGNTILEYWISSLEKKEIKI